MWLASQSTDFFRLWRFEPPKGGTSALAVSADLSTLIHATTNAFAQIGQNVTREWSRIAGGDEMIRPTERYRQIADNYDRLALDVSDQALRSLYLDFGQQWREVAARAEAVDIKNASQELKASRWEWD